MGAARAGSRVRVRVRDGRMTKGFPLHRLPLVIDGPLADGAMENPAQ